MSFSQNTINTFNKTEFVEALSEMQEEGFEIFQDAMCSDPFDSKKKISFPIVVLSRQGICPFVFLENIYENGQLLSAETVEYTCNVFRHHFGIKQKILKTFVLSPSAMGSERFGSETNKASELRLFLYQPQHTSSTGLTPYTQVAAIQTVAELSQPISENLEAFNDFEYEDIIAKLTKECDDYVCAGGERATVYVKKDNEWVVASNRDTERTFRLALYGGIVGSHRFYLRMYGSGVLYALTLGLLGVGWFFDCLEILLGVWNKKGKRLLPLENRRPHVIEFIFVFLIVFTLIALFFLL